MDDGTHLLQQLLYVILAGIVLVLSMMVGITCLLVHHNHNLRHLRHEAMKKSPHNPQTPKQKSAGSSKPDNVDYVTPRHVMHPMQAPNYQSPQPPMYLTPLGRQYENVNRDSDSAHSYESVDKFHP